MYLGSPQLEHFHRRTIYLELFSLLNSNYIEGMEGKLFAALLCTIYGAGVKKYV